MSGISLRFTFVALAAASVAGAACSSASEAGDDSGSQPASDAGAGGETGAASEAGADPTADTVITLHYPVGSGHSISVRGASPLSPAVGAKMSVVTQDGGESDVMELHVAVPASVPVLEYTPMYDDATPARGGAYHVPRGGHADIYPHFFSQKGSWSQLFPAFASALLNEPSRVIWAYVPPSYSENTLARYPVLYTHDGQNDFDPAYNGGGPIEPVADSMDQGVEAGTTAELIVIGIQSINRNRDLVPVPDVNVPGSNPAYGPQYVEFMRTELKPAVDAALRTKPERESTGTLGSSLGGLMAAYAGVHAPETFGVLGEMSPSAWVAGDFITHEVANAPALASESAPFDGGPYPPIYADGGEGDPSCVGFGFLKARVYMDEGSVEDGALHASALAASYTARGQSAPDDFKFFQEVGGVHDIESWGRRLPGALAWMFPGSRDGH